MAEISDELLMAYADGELDPVDRATIEAAIQGHPGYLEKVEKFRATREPIRQAFRTELEGNHLGPLIDRIHSEEARPVVNAVEPSVARVVGISAAKAWTQTYRFRPRVPAAMAASVALLIGGALGWSVHSNWAVTLQHSPGFVRFSNGDLLAQGALQELLEKASSGTGVIAQVEDGESWKLDATFTFRAVSRLPCRRYEISGDVSGRFAGYACRSGAGQWRIGAHANLETRMPNGKGFAPAAGDGDAALEGAIRIIMDGDVYQSTEEDELIQGRWSTLGK